MSDKGLVSTRCNCQPSQQCGEGGGGGHLGDSSENNGVTRTWSAVGCYCHRSC